MAAGAVIAVPGPQGVSSAASGPSCGNVADTAPHCYVEADVGNPHSYPVVTSVAGRFTAPKQLAVKSPAYSRAQIALHGNGDIELGWLVDPAHQHGSEVPHLFVSFSRDVPQNLSPLNDYCQEGLNSGPECPPGDYLKLSSKYSAGMAIGGTPALFSVGFDTRDKFWYLQYQNQYIAKMAGSWWRCGVECEFEFDRGSWSGEVYTPSSSSIYRCTPMGNGNYGSGRNAASVSDMEFRYGGSILDPAEPAAQVTLMGPDYPQYWDSDRTPGGYGEYFSSSFSFGGPYNGPSGCKAP